ncbi:hypothetical protein [Helicobacter burdigaliensis]|uniref:hypothetical protein n=1 Tax=Helicobacter burdigaliensis TaxID=2315334 RepID=UPI0013003C9C|nr:hypothetical protein [Helicobacter burdigaliensis]
MTRGYAFAPFRFAPCFMDCFIATLLAGTKDILVAFYALFIPNNFCNVLKTTIAKAQW